MSHFLTPPSSGLKTKADSVLYFFIGEGILQNDGNPAFLVHVKCGIIAFLRKDTRYLMYNYIGTPEEQKRALAQYIERVLSRPDINPQMIR